MTKLEKARDIKIICDKCGCGESLRKIHFDLFVNKDWQPHASLRFKKWWFAQLEFQDSKDKDGVGISAEVAQNAGRIWDAYLEAKEIGLA